MFVARRASPHRDPRDPGQDRECKQRSDRRTANAHDEAPASPPLYANNECRRLIQLSSSDCLHGSLPRQPWDPTLALRRSLGGRPDSSKDSRKVMYMRLNSLHTIVSDAQTTTAFTVRLAEEFSALL